jgi:hypothetical protein
MPQHSAATTTPCPHGLLIQCDTCPTCMATLVNCRQCRHLYTEEECPCVPCPDCSETVNPDDICSTCDNCDHCCTCYVCQRARCSARVESVCSACERCDDCCDCIYCEGCDERHHQDTDFCSDCECCVDSCSCEQDCTIHKYETDVTDYLSFLGKPQGGFFLGVELEMQAENNLPSKAEAWKNACEDWALLKHDGSVSYGFEVVTAPASLDIHKEEWTRLLGDNTLTNGMKSWDTACCGMHVHVSRAPMTPLHLGKILVFMNSPLTYGPIVKLAGRNSNHWAEYHTKKVTDGKSTCSVCYKVVKHAGHVWCKACQTYRYGRTGSNSRYQAVNVCNTDTIEFRIFKGTLKLEHVLANIEFVDAVVRWTKDCSIRDCESWQAFMAYVQLHKKTYSHLLTYLERD